MALEAARGLKTINQTASEHGVHPNLVGQWKRQLMDEGASVFDKGTANHRQQQQAQESELYEQIGRLKMELEWLKKSCLPRLGAKWNCKSHFIVHSVAERIALAKHGHDEAPR